MDRPADKGGADKGPLGGEYQLIALGHCFTSHLLATIRAREFEISAVKVEVTGTLDGSPERFTELTLSVSATCDDLESLRKAVLIAERACQVVNTLKLAAQLMVTVRQAQAA